jgi:hypothetical protein
MNYLNLLLIPLFLLGFLKTSSFSAEKLLSESIVSHVQKDFQLFSSPEKEQKLLETCQNYYSCQDNKTLYFSTLYHLDPQKIFSIKEKFPMNSSFYSTFDNTQNFNVVAVDDWLIGCPTKTTGISTPGLYHCVAGTAWNPETKTTGVFHIAPSTSLDLIDEMFKNLLSNSEEIEDFIIHLITTGYQTNLYRVFKKLKQLNCKIVDVNCADCAYYTHSIENVEEQYTHHLREIYSNSTYSIDYFNRLNTNVAIDCQSGKINITRTTDEPSWPAKAQRKKL